MDRRDPLGLRAGRFTDAPTASKLVLYEDDRELRPSHSSHETIRQLGGGAYSHWHNTLYFSTSDRSDPRTNRRKYRIALGSLKLVVIAVDGTDPRALRRYIAEGRLPAIARIFFSGRARLKSKPRANSSLTASGRALPPHYQSGRTAFMHSDRCVRELCGGYLLHDLLHRLGLSVPPVPGDPESATFPRTSPQDAPLP